MIYHATIRKRSPYIIPESKIYSSPWKWDGLFPPRVDFWFPGSADPPSRCACHDNPHAPVALHPRSELPHARPGRDSAPFCKTRRSIVETYPPVNKHSNGKSPSWIGNTSSNGGFSMAMLDYWSVVETNGSVKINMYISNSCNVLSSSCKK